ncbi:aminoglycoside phosphotransferase family protein [Chitinophaga costaii]|uniref:aminoglycoside phosphotransferase family protein n=1 Tax=Chitinophaga costaii TaxID=1335309 RepID=UPI0013FDAA5D|nr:aminoglycoside phosphotransferase family protein [Chitinophaga costaii]
MIKHFGIHPRRLSPLGGYSNQNTLVETDTGEYVARLSRHNRHLDSVRVEEHVLQSLEDGGYTKAPRLVQRFSTPLQMGHRFLHLFYKIPGQIPCRWWQHCSETKLEQVFSGLAELHRALSRILSIHDAGKGMYQWYRMPAAPPAALESTATGRYVIAQWEHFCESANKLQEAAARLFPWDKGHYQWIHGDVQLENVLFDQDQLTAFLDFEMVRWDACEKDVIFSAFRVCKEGPEDGLFRYDASRLQKAIAAYRNTGTHLHDGFFDRYDAFWKPFFCMDQALVYLHNAFDQVWVLEDNIGFMPCFNEVLHYYEW